MVELKTVQVSDVPIDILDRAREEAIRNGVPKSDSATMRYALAQFVKSLDADRVVVATGQG